MLGSDLADLQTVGLAGTGILGVDDIGNVALTQCAGDLFAAFADLAQSVGADAVLFQIAGGSVTLPYNSKLKRRWWRWSE